MLKKILNSKGKQKEPSGDVRLVWDSKDQNKISTQAGTVSYWLHMARGSVQQRCLLITLVNIPFQKTEYTITTPAYRQYIFTNRLSLYGLLNHWRTELLSCNSITQINFLKLTNIYTVCVITLQRLFDSGRFVTQILDEALYMVWATGYLIHITFRDFELSTSLCHCLSL
jgi:hypothetical protein